MIEPGDTEIQHRQQQAQGQPPESLPKAQHKASCGSELDVTAAHAFRLDQSGNQQRQGCQGTQKLDGAERDQPRRSSQETKGIWDNALAAVHRRGGGQRREEQERLHLESAVVVEHFLHALGHGGQDGVPEQGVQAGQEQSTQHHGDQDLDGGIDVALAAGAAEGGGQAGTGAGHGAVGLAGHGLHGV